VIQLHCFDVKKKTEKMDYVLRKLDELQEALYDLEDFLENNRENEVLEFVSDHWKECLMGGVITFFALYQGRSFITVSTLRSLF
jgi:hypothetical protein